MGGPSLLCATLLLPPPSDEGTCLRLPSLPAHQIPQAGGTMLGMTPKGSLCPCSHLPTWPSSHEEQQRLSLTRHSQEQTAGNKQENFIRKRPACKPSTRTQHTPARGLRGEVPSWCLVTAIHGDLFHGDPGRQHPQLAHDTRASPSQQLISLRGPAGTTGTHEGHHVAATSQVERTGWLRSASEVLK
ncbi:hypothetical protein P7K49_032547 [Saguinus oedipus]|uniref:Uncharacterized protein n=1 Tax=Saguinus oedipus TaxID=9490 RepID=A0ABQ9TYK2_SAGOE|nr:hypothetical protein P7K49_032547 [Saguinus oedipus]